MEYLLVSPDKTIKFVKAVCALHNWIRKSGYNSNAVPVVLWKVHIVMRPGLWVYWILEHLFREIMQQKQRKNLLLRLLL